MAEKKAQDIEITHFINPHLFWYKNAGKSNESQKTVIEQKLSQFAKRHYNQNCANNSNTKISAGDSAAVYYLKEQKWVRATVDEFNLSEESVILWADDYGIPMKCSRNLVLPLDDELKQLCTSCRPRAYQAGIFGIMPASYQLNIEKEQVMIRLQRWDAKAVQSMKLIIESGKCEFQFTLKEFAEGSDFGNLLIISPSKMEMASSFLIKVQFAMPQEGFKEVIASSKTIQIDRWLNNDQHLDCICNEGPLPDNNGTVAEKPRITRVMMLNNNLQKQLKMQNQQTTSKRSQCSDASTSSTAKAHKNNSMLDDKLELNKSIATNKNVTVPQSKKMELLRRYRGMIKPESNSSEQQSQASSEHSGNIARGSESVISSIEFNDNPGLIRRTNLQSIYLYNNEEHPLEAITEANFTQNTHRAMKKANLTEVYALQSYAWPNILRGNSVLMIESKNRGKTLAYLPALCSSVRRDQENDRNSFCQMGTVAVIICMSDSIPMIAKYCREFLDYVNFKHTVIEGVLGEDGKIEANLCNGCSILVTSVPCLQQLMDNEFLLQNDKLKYIAIENIDVLMKKYGSDLRKLLTKLAFDKNKKPRQLMITSRIWKPEYNEFMEATTCDAVLMIGNFFEAALQLKIKMELQLCLSGIKNEKVLERIKSIAIDKERTLIICERLEEVQAMADCLDSAAIPYRVAQNLESEFELGKLKSFWNGKKGIVIGSDETVYDTKIRNAMHVLHYSLPSTNFRRFENRFAAQVELDSPGTCWIAFDENNQVQWPKITELLRRGKQKLPKHLEDITLQIRSEMNKLRQSEHKFEPVCNHVFMYGNTEQTTCQNRHLLLPSDMPIDENAYVNQELRFHLCKIISPTEYIVRPLKVRTSNGWKVIIRSDEYATFKIRFHIHYMNQNHLVRPESFELGQLCVVFVDQSPQRAEIIHIFKKKNVLDNDIYNVRLIDVGENIIKKSSPDIFNMDDEFKEFPVQAYHMHLTGILPSNGEQDWGSKAIRVFENRIKKLQTDFPNIEYDARVIFSLRNAFVVDKIRAADTRNIISHLFFEKELLDKKLGYSSKDAVTRVKRIAKEAGVYFEKKIGNVEKCESSESSIIPDATDSTIVSKKSVESAHLPVELNGSAEDDVAKDLMDFSFCSNSKKRSYNDETECLEKWTEPPSIERGRIVITKFFDADNFYINYDSKELKDLYRDIDAHMGKLREDLNCSIEYPDIGEYCLVKCDNSFVRGKVIRADYTEKEITLKIFCVDTGAVVIAGSVNVYDLPKALLEKLPFQVIWCRLAGIRPTTDQWTNTDSDLIYDEIDQYRNALYAYRLSGVPELKSKFFDINISRCDVVLVATDDSNQINLNMGLVSIGLVDLDDGFDIEIMEKIPFVKEDNDEEEDWDSIQVENSRALNLNQNTEIKQVIDNGGELFDNFTDEDIIALLAPLTIDPKTKSQPIESAVQTVGDKVEPRPMEVIDTEFDEKTIQSPPKGLLSYKHKRPMICWRQDKQWIVLTIKADDQVKYHLQVSEDSLIYSAIQNDEKYKAVINLFGCIEPQLTKHVLRGLNVVVRLKKSTFWLWPRFCRSVYKCTWITPNLERMIFEDAAKEEYYLDAMAPIIKGLNASDRRSTDDSDEESANQIEDEDFEGDSDEEDD